MEWVIFVAALMIGVNIIALIHFNINVSELEHKITRLHDLSYDTYRNTIAIRESVVQNADVLGVSGTADELTPDVETEELTQNELARLARKEAFDRRIAEMREELGYEQYGTHGEELMPEVKNLPHNIIPTSLYDLPSVEIAD